LGQSICPILLHCSSSFWPLKQRPKRRRLTSSSIKKKIDRVSAGFDRVARVPGWPAGSTGFHRANSQAGFCLHPDRFHAWVGRVSDRPTGPVRVLKHCFKPFSQNNEAVISKTPQNNFHSKTIFSNIFHKTIFKRFDMSFSCGNLNFLWYIQYQNRKYLK